MTAILALKIAAGLLVLVSAAYGVSADKTKVGPTSIKQAIKPPTTPSARSTFMLMGGGILAVVGLVAMAVFQDGRAREREAEAQQRKAEVQLKFEQARLERERLQRERQKQVSNQNVETRNFPLKSSGGSTSRNGCWKYINGGPVNICD